MRKLLIFLFAMPLAAQTINPNQIKPSTHNGYVLTTQTGSTVWAPASGGGSGVLTCDPLSPLFTCNVSGTNMHFTLSSTPNFTFYGRFDGSSGAPKFWTLEAGDNVTIDTPDSDTVRISAAATTASFKMLVTPPIAGDYCIVRPTGHSQTNNNPRTLTTSDDTSGLIISGATGGSFPPAGANIHFTFTGALAQYCPQINPANVTAVYAYANEGGINGYGAMTGICSGNTLNPGGLLIGQTTTSTALTGATIGTATCDFTFSNSSSQAVRSYFNIADAGLIVFSSDAGALTSGPIIVTPPLIYNPSQGPGLYIDPSFPTSVIGDTYANLPAAFGSLHTLRYVIDCNSPTTCTAGGGTDQVVMISNGSTWSVYGGGGGGGSGITGLTTGQVGIAGSATTLTSSIALGTSANNIPQLDGSGKLLPGVLPLGSSSAFGALKVDNVTCTTAAGVLTCPGTAGAVSSVIATSPITVNGGAGPATGAVTIDCPTCSVGSGTSVKVNGGSILGTANLSNTTPAAGSNGKNVAFQNSGSDVSAEVVGDGNAAHYLDGTGAYSTPAGSGGGGISITQSLTTGNLQRAVIANVNGDSNGFADGTQFYNAAAITYIGAWAADTWYAVHGYPAAFSATKLKYIVDKFVGGVSGTSLPIVLAGTAGTPVYFSGCQSDHTTPSSDGALFVPMLEYAYYTRSGDLTDFVTNAATLKAAIQAIPLSGGLVNIAGAHPFAAWGFHDGIVNTGVDLMGSLNLYQAATTMAIMYTANGDTANATTMTTIATNVSTALGSTGSTLWNAGDGMYYAASTNNHQDDVLGSAFALYLGIPTGPMKTAISSYLVTNYTALTGGTGYIHQSPSNWANSVGGNQCTKGTGNYDDGRWSVGNEWIWTALNYGSPSQALQFMVDFNANSDPTQEYYGASLNGATKNLESPMGNAAIAQTFYPYMINLPPPYTGLSLTTNGAAGVNPWAPFSIRDTQSGGGYWQEGPGVGNSVKGWELYSGSNAVWLGLLNGHFLSGTASDCGNQVCVSGGVAADSYRVAAATAGSYVKADGTGFGVPAPLTTKGDILGFSSANARVPVGANGTVLTADSTQTLGVKWASTGTATVICSGSQALGTTAIGSGAAATTITTTCTGLLTTDNIQLDFNADPTATTGYIPSASGMLTIIKWPTANTINISVVNNTASSITPGAVTVNYRVVR